MQVANASPNSHLYPLSGINRLVLFLVLAYGLAMSVNSREQYRWLFVGLFVGTVFCALLGLLNHYGIVSLSWYGIGPKGRALRSMFLNRGWFAEFVLTLVPFVLLGFMSRITGLWWKMLLFGSLVICELALILAGARAGWVSYPLILIICWLFSYFSKEGRFESFHFGWKDLVKVAVSVPITIGISFLLIFQVLMPLSAYLGEKTGSTGIQERSKASTGLIKSQAGRLLKVGKGGRYYTWGEGLNVGKERPVFGMGYESFNWHANILVDMPESYFHRFYTEAKVNRIDDTPHNIFYQLFVSGGIVGLCLWMVVIFYAMLILIVDLVKNKRLINTPVVISIISFHIYGIFQSMQYIPMIWSVIFLNLGYAMTIDDKVLPDRLRRITGVMVKVMIFLVLIGGVVYFMGRGSQDLADRYGLMVYAQDQDWHDYSGFYQKEKWAGGGYRWSGGKGLVKIES
ncbi:MAG TPA: O-antigen ligase family protein, partial [Deltaproteobacteria bacterium]|nr:O-antigen ligase family protein [Deltaproteobacteria bacterium]